MKKASLTKRILLGLLSTSLVLGSGMSLAAAAETSEAAPATTEANSTETAASEAQASGMSDAAEGDVNTHSLQETVVTGARRGYAGNRVGMEGPTGIFGNKKVLDTPFNVVTFNEQAFKDFSAPGTALTDVLTLDPSVRSSSSTLYNDISIRGFNASGHFYYINNIPGLLSQANLPTLYAEKVTVMAGPGSGTNATSFRDMAGGTVNITSKKAKDKPNLDVGLTYSGRSSFEESLDVGGRFGKDNRYGVRLMASNVTGGTAVKGEDLRQQNLWINIDQRTKSSRTNLLYGYNHTDHRAGMWSLSFSNNVTRLPGAIDGSRNLKPDWAYNEYQNDVFALNHEQKLSDHTTVFLNAGWHRNDWYGYVDGTVGVMNNAGDYAISFSNWPILVYTRYIGGGIRGDFKLGSVKNDYVLSVDRETQMNFSSGKPGFEPTAKGNINFGVSSWTYSGTADDVARRASHTAVNGWHILDTLTLPGDKLMLTLGLHGHSATVDSYNTTTGALKSSVNTSATSPTFGIAYKFTPKLTAYANHAESFTVGSVVSSDYVNAGEVLDPAKTKQNEVGVKWENKGLLQTLSYFEIKQPNQVVEYTGGTIFQRLTQNGEQENRGLEYMISGSVAPKWDLIAGFMYLNAKQTRTTNGLFDGKDVNGAAKFSGSLAAIYKPSRDWSIINRLNYTGDASLFTSSNAAAHELSVPSHLTWDLGATWKTTWEKTPVTLSLMCYNVTNEKYWQPRVGQSYLIVGAPRTFMFSAGFSL